MCVRLYVMHGYCLLNPFVRGSCSVILLVLMFMYVVHWFIFELPILVLSIYILEIVIFIGSLYFKWVGDCTIDLNVIDRPG